MYFSSNGYFATIGILVSSFALGSVGDIKTNPLISHAENERIPGSYIVVLKKQTTREGVDAFIKRSVKSEDITFKYSHVFKGFSANLSKDKAEKLSNDPEVEYIEEDSIVRAVGSEDSPNIAAIQPNPPSWGLDRIDQTDLPLNSSYEYMSMGNGANAYVIDTGIRITHSDFEGRAFSGFTSVNDGNGTNDCNGHGTHVAGTIGGKSYGVAKAATLHAVRVLGCTGSGATSGVIAGIDWVHANHKSPAVINMSLGGGASTAMDAAVKSVVDAGVVVVVAAGNSGDDACLRSPARAPEAIAVGATTREDARAAYSSIGKCVALFAPGSQITSAWKDSDTDSRSISGTSMASPHVAGVAALYFELDPIANPETVRKAILEATVSNRIKDVMGSPNLFLQSSVKGGGGGECIRSNPTITLSPSNQTGKPGASLDYSLTLVNRDSQSCGVSKFAFSNSLPLGFTGSFSISSIDLSPGSTGNALLHLMSPSNASNGAYLFTVNATNTNNPASIGSANGTYTVATGDTTGLKLEISQNGTSFNYNSVATFKFSLTNNSGGVPNVPVKVSIRGPVSFSLNPTTNKDGIATVYLSINSSLPFGTYNVTATSAFNGENATASSSFIVQ